MRPVLIDRLELPAAFSGDGPVSKQIAECLRQGIIDGLVSPNIILPSVREMAVQLGVSRSTAARAIEELSAQGYVVAEMGSGTKVAARLPGELEEKPSVRDEHAPLKEVELSAFARRLMSRQASGAISTLVSYNGPSLKDVPLGIWRDLIARHCRAGVEVDSSSASQLSYAPEPFGYPPLREAYASYLTRARAVKVNAERLVVFASRNLRLDLIARLLLSEGDLVAIEEPGFSTAREQLLARGATVLPIGVDSQGMKVDELIAAGPVKLIYVTPSHQEPTGAVLSMIRRKQLLDYAAKCGAYIIEDDYDSEFRYDGRPLPSLQGMDSSDRVIYLSCLWNVLAPVTRLGFMVLPAGMVQAVHACKSLVERDVSYIEQAALSDFINEGHLEKLIRQKRQVYASCRQSLISKLESIFDRQIWTAPESAGLELLVRFQDGFDSQTIERAALQSGFPITNTSWWYFGNPRPLEYTISFTWLAEEEMARRLEHFASLLSA